MAPSAISSKCKIRKCTPETKFMLDPCDDKYYYSCGNSITRMPCGEQTHFTGGKLICNHIRFPSKKEKFRRVCNIKKNFSLEKCRKIWPEDATKWNKINIDRFLSRNRTTTPPQKSNNLLVPLIIISLLLLCSLVAFIVLLKRRKENKQTHPNIINNNNILPEKEDDHIYEEIRENEVTTAIPVPVVDVPNQENPHQDKYATTEASINEEEEYHVLSIVGIQQNSESSDILPDGYSSLNINYAGHSNDLTNESVNY